MVEIIILKGVSAGISAAIAHSKRFENAMVSLMDAGLKTDHALDNLSNIMNTVCKKQEKSMPYCLINCSFLFDGRTPWAPLHGIQAKFFRFNPKKWHTAAARFIPTGHRATYFYRKCWMHAKTFMNVELEELEELEVVL